MYDLMEALKMENQHAIENNEVLAFKTFPTRPIIVEGLKEMGAKFAQLQRGNVLDYFVCRIRDCFKTHRSKGHAVFANNGTHADYCFTRRYDKEVKVMAYVKPEVVVNTIHNNQKQIQADHKAVEHVLSPSATQTYEDLFALKYSSDEGVFQSSVTAWTSLLRSMVDNIDKDIVASVLRPMKGTSTPPLPHNELIYNYNEVGPLLKAA